MGEVVSVGIPYSPRPLFLPYHNRTQRFSCEVVHRRGGKTVSRVNELIKRALLCQKERPRFAYIAPLLKQAKTVAWDYLKHYSFPFVQHGATFNESELRVDYPNGGQVRLYGGDNPDALRGIYLDGVVLDEYGDMDPGIWPVVRPALSDRHGWADFLGTPKGENDFYEIWKKAKASPDEWYAAMHKASETGIIDAEELAQARKDLTRDQYNQEYECSFTAPIRGAYYGEEFSDAIKTKRICHVPYDKSVDVFTAWDLGIGDSTAIWFAQKVGQEIHLIDYVENSGVGLDWYAKEIKNRPYVYDSHFLPHDANSKELGTGKSRTDVLAALGIKATVLPRTKIEDGIAQVRLILNRCWFDEQSTERGVKALKHYHTEYNEKTKTFSDRPAHDWSSHAADAFRYLAMSLDKTTKPEWSAQVMNYTAQWVA